MTTTIHSTAIIGDKVHVGEGTTIGPYVVIEDDVVIGDRCTIGPHAVIGSFTAMGQECRVFAGAAVGLIPQDVKFKGERTTLRIGDRTTIREFCTLNRGTAERGETTIGNDCLLLAYCHVGHDCIIGDRVIASNSLAMAGHVKVGSNVTIGGVCAFHQFVRVGDCAMVGANSYVTRDIVPFAITGSDPVRVAGVNKVKLERLGYSPERRSRIRGAFRILFRENLTVSQAIEKLAGEYAGDEDVGKIVDFVNESGRSILRMRNDDSTSS